MNESKLLKTVDSKRYKSFVEMKKFLDNEILHIFNIKLDITNEELMKIHGAIYDYCLEVNMDIHDFFNEYILNVLTYSMSNKIVSIEKFIGALEQMGMPSEINEKIVNISKVR